MTPEGKYRDAREWMALAVSPAVSAASDVARGLTRYDFDAAGISVTHSYVTNALKRLSEAQEHLVRAKITLETIDK